MQINDILSQIYNILNCKIALSIDNRLFLYPPQAEAALEDDFTAVENYKELEIEKMNGRAAFYVEGDADASDDALSLAVLYIRSQLVVGDDINQSMHRLLGNSYSHSDAAAINPLLGAGEPLHLIVVNGINISDNRAELFEIIKSSLSVKLLTEYQGSIVAIVEESDINEACNGLYKNILTEIYENCIIAIGGSLQAPQQFAELYNLCLEAIQLKEKYSLNENVLDYGGMSVYRLVASMDAGLKQSITQRIFNNKFVEMLNNEMELTIEEMFRNNLNLTDTSARLFVHRNTLLYRIDKIYRQTGFDLRKFEDSMVFKLAWLMYKEKNI